MTFRLFVAIFLSGIAQVAGASGAPAMPFVDGRWHGEIQPGLDSSDFECRASTMGVNGTSLTLGKREDGTWRLQLSSPDWHLQLSHQYALVALVDFYPRLHLTAAAESPTLLEIDKLEQIGMLELIENGHTLTLSSDDFNGKYELEGSAKVISRIRTCFADQVA